jgi:hypothetical protein
MTNATMTRKELQFLLKTVRSKGLTKIKLTVSTAQLQAEYDYLEKEAKKGGRALEDWEAL